MARKENDFLRLSATRNIANDVRGLLLPAVPAAERESHPHGCAVTDETVEQVGIGIGDRSRRDFRDAGVVFQRAGVRRPVRVGSDRANENPDRAELRRGGRAAAPDLYGLAVAGAVRGAPHVAVEEDDLSADVRFLLFPEFVE